MRIHLHQFGIELRISPENYFQESSSELGQSVKNNDMRILSSLVQII